MRAVCGRQLRHVHPMRATPARVRSFASASSGKTLDPVQVARYSMPDRIAHRAVAIGDVASPNVTALQTTNVSAESLRFEEPEPPTTSRNAYAEACMTSFRWPAALGSREVSVIGSFSGWSEPVPLQRLPNGDFVRTIALAHGSHQYKFIVDGEWRNSISEAVVTDGQGYYNNQITVAPSAELSYQSSGPSQEVFVVTSFSGWSELIPLVYDPVLKRHSVKYSLQPGTYQYKFLVDGEWCVSPEQQEVKTEGGWSCNQIIVPAPTAFTLFYATGWQEVLLNYRYLSEDGTPQGEWCQMPMTECPSRAKPVGGQWRMACVPANAAAPSSTTAVGKPKLEFTVTDGNGGLDKPLGCDAYRLQAPGGFKLIKGRITPFPRALQPPMMLVSDLDGTMVQDNNEGDYHMRRFTEYWENNASLARSVLVYNTGRSLGQFMGLWNGKRGDLALPDILITAVGTKVWRLEDTQGAGRSRLAAEPVWTEDLAWARRLDEGWNLAAVRKVAERAMHRQNGAASWLDEGTEHPHRVALSVRQDRVVDVCTELRAGFENAGVKVRLVTSGTGEWRYVDCVAFRAGKLEAMEYVRSMYSIPKERCVAAGDSGNDILMMEGSHPVVVVGNSQPELVEWALSNNDATRVVFTEGYYAGGILEGLARHGLF